MQKMSIRVDPKSIRPKVDLTQICCTRTVEPDPNKNSGHTVDLYSTRSCICPEPIFSNSYPKTLVEFGSSSDRHVGSI